MTIKIKDYDDACYYVRELIKIVGTNCDIKFENMLCAVSDCLVIDGSAETNHKYLKKAYLFLVEDEFDICEELEDKDAEYMKLVLEALETYCCA